MKIRLMTSEENQETLAKMLMAAGFEIGEDGEFMLTEAGSERLLPVRDAAGRRLMIAASEIIYAESFRHDVEVHTADGCYNAFDPLYRVAELLGSREFMRVSNCAVISKSHVKKIRPALSMKFVLTMSDGTQIDVTRNYYYAFKEFFGIL